ncbi:MAG: transglutaminase family protein [Herminiimonas sp.]|uniref:transglutaminase family protein n=1 Tax=Herminiimonas sp. TaxID=1926289 RepID=UPI0027179338|nr:transglutaminase family protein [Herminiimonas sp.]MDO9421534.1 transglutaminase family protein [Herminiimonas sp.]
MCASMTNNPVAHYRIVHQTRYTYQSMVTLSQQYLHMSPRSFCYQDVLSHDVQIGPEPAESSDSADYFGNSTRYITITAPHQELLVHAEFTVAVRARQTVDAISATLPWETVRDELRQFQGGDALEPLHFLYASPHVICSKDLAQYALISFTPGRPHLDAALDLTKRIYDDFEFDGEATDISTPLAQVLTDRRGVCQDFAQLMIGCLRSIGLPARYVSGYILTHPPAGQPRLIGADASHAWASVFCPEFGWVDFDPTNGCLVQHEHITLGWGRDFSDVTPMRGIVLGGGKHGLQVNVTVSVNE